MYSSKTNRLLSNLGVVDAKPYTMTAEEKEQIYQNDKAMPTNVFWDDKSKGYMSIGNIPDDELKVMIELTKLKNIKSIKYYLLFFVIITVISIVAIIMHSIFQRLS
jgi:hypothetical protein